MDTELREALYNLREEQKEDTIRLHTKLDELTKEMRDRCSKHMVQNAGDTARLETTTQAAHRRLDEHLDGHKDVRKSILSLWVGFVLAILGAGIATVKAVFMGKGGQAP